MIGTQFERKYSLQIYSSGGNTITITNWDARLVQTNDYTASSYSIEIRNVSGSTEWYQLCSNGQTLLPYYIRETLCDGTRYINTSNSKPTNAGVLIDNYAIAIMPGICSSYGLENWRHFCNIGTKNKSKIS